MDFLRAKAHLEAGQQAVPPVEEGKEESKQDEFEDS